MTGWLNMQTEMIWKTGKGVRSEDSRNERLIRSILLARQDPLRLRREGLLRTLKWYWNRANRPRSRVRTHSRNRLKR